MKEFTIPVEFSVWSTIRVSAESMEEAYKIAKEKEDEIPIDFIGDMDYVDGSYVIADDDDTKKLVAENFYAHIGEHGVDENGEVY